MASTLTTNGITCGDGTNINGTTYNTIGTYTVGNKSGPAANTAVNDTLAGTSILSPTTSGISFSPFSPISVNEANTSASRTGTWRCMQRARNGGANKGGEYQINPTLWVRIS